MPPDQRDAGYLLDMLEHAGEDGGNSGDCGMSRTHANTEKKTPAFGVP
jgi:hypothetical protein